MIERQKGIPSKEKVMTNEKLLSGLLLVAVGCCLVTCGLSFGGTLMNCCGRLGNPRSNSFYCGYDSGPNSRSRTYASINGEPSKNYYLIQSMINGSPALGIWAEFNEIRNGVYINLFGQEILDTGDFGS